jgi:hypothetical protein
MDANTLASYYTFLTTFISLMLQFPTGNVGSLFSKESAFFHVIRSRRESLKEVFLKESSPPPGVPAAVTGYNRKRQQWLAALNVLVRDCQDRLMVRMAEQLPSASFEVVMAGLQDDQLAELNEVSKKETQCIGLKACEIHFNFSKLLLRLYCLHILFG